MGRRKEGAGSCLSPLSACVLISRDRVVIYGTVEEGNNTHVVGGTKVFSMETSQQRLPLVLVD